LALAGITPAKANPAPKIHSACFLKNKEGLFSKRVVLYYPSRECPDNAGIHDSLHAFAIGFAGAPTCLPEALLFCKF